MKKRSLLRIEQLEPRVTPDLALGSGAAAALPSLTAGLGDSSLAMPQPGTGIEQPLDLGSATDAARATGLLDNSSHLQALEALFVDDQRLDSILQRSARSCLAPEAAQDQDSQVNPAAAGEAQALGTGALGWQFMRNYTRKAVRNEELKHGPLRDSEDIVHQVFVEWREQTDNGELALANLLNKDSAERLLLRKSVRRVLDRVRYEQVRQQKMVEFIDQPAPLKPAEADWVDLQIDMSTGAGRLGPRERLLLELRRQGMTFEEIGSETGMAKQRVCEIYNAAVQRLQALYCP
jgi:Sigma-70, region 4